MRNSLYPSSSRKRSSPWLPRNDFGTFLQIPIKILSWLYFCLAALLSARPCGLTEVDRLERKKVRESAEDHHEGESKRKLLWLRPPRNANPPGNIAPWPEQQT
jgi:hypothetical protein